MKRLWVRPSARGLGVGRALVDRVLVEARERGYREIVLDTLPVMGDAQRLYERAGFHDVEPYYDSPVPGTRFMRRAL
jgi:ribosomal protein S18 acetylase RimI-like enzyme